MKIIPDNVYEWMLRNFPYKLMYKKVYFGSSFMSVPRFTKRQIEEVEEKVKEKYKDLKSK